MNITVNNQPVFIATSGKDINPEKPTWVFIHGAAMDHTIWALFNRYFTSIGANVLAVDLPGHGQSGGAAFTRIEQSTDWLAEVLEQVGVKKAIIAGHSMGSLIAYDFASRYQSHCLGLVLLGFCLPMPVNQMLLDLSQANDHKAFEMVVEFGYAGSAKLGCAQSPGLWMTQSGLRLMEKSAPGSLFADFTACNEYQSQVDIAATINCPTLFIAGDSDKMTPARGLKTWHAAIAASHVEIIPGCGHMMMMEKPNQVSALLKNFYKQLVK